jgi:CubicO group peptidase (beta-lactamase class C family)
MKRSLPSIRTRSRSRSTLVVLLAVLAACGGGGERGSKADQLGDFVRAELRRQGVPGAAVAVVEDGVVVYEQGFGSKDLAGTAPVGPDTLFAAGSCTKMLVAGALLTLREEGRLDLDAPITDYLPSTFQLLDADPSTIHVRNLLAHTSGIPHWLPASCSESLSEWYQDEDRRTHLLVPPGTVWNYSGAGYSLAGLVLERIAGEPFAEAMRHRIFEPAGMTRATFDPEVAMADDHSLGHYGAGPSEVELDSIYCPMAQPAGSSLYVSAPQLARFAAALLAGGGAVLQPASVAAMQERQTDTHVFPGEGYGLGLSMRDAGGVRVYYHGGNDGRFAASVALVPDRNVAVAVLFNRDGWVVPQVVAQKALELYAGIRDAVPEAVYAADPDAFLTDPSTWAKYTGTYDEPLRYGRVVVTLEDGKLVVELVDTAPGVKMEAVQAAGDLFHVAEADLNVAFWFDGDPGAAKYGVSRDAVFTRVEAEE